MSFTLSDWRNPNPKKHNGHEARERMDWGLAPVRYTPPSGYIYKDIGRCFNCGARVYQRPYPEWCERPGCRGAILSERAQGAW